LGGDTANFLTILANGSTLLKVNVMKPIYLMLALLLNVSLALPAFAAGYLKFDGVDGEATDRAHKGWLEVMSVTQASPREAASGLPTGKRQHKPVTITKPVDKATPILAESLKSGKLLTNVSVEFDGEIIDMKSAVVTRIERDAAGHEVVTLSPVGTDAISRSAPPGHAVKSSMEGAEARKGKVETQWKVEEGTK
jgi:hypothetical protein